MRMHDMVHQPYRKRTSFRARLALPSDLTICTRRRP